VAVEVDVSLEEEEEEIAVIVEVAVEAVIIDPTISNSHSHRGFLHSTHKATGTMGSILNTEVLLEEFYRSECSETVRVGRIRVLEF
jgi:hypothetical protein